MPGDLVLTATDGGIATLTLNRPVRHNSLVPELLTLLLHRLEHINRQADLTAVVLRANGRSFSTGGDVQAFFDHRSNLADYASEIVGLLNQVILSLVRLPIPIVTAVHGMVTGGSLGLVLASDLVLVSPEASFTPYYSVVGFSPDGGWSVMLPRVIGVRRTAEVLMLNRTITAEEAVQWGIANRIVPAASLGTEAYATAQTLGHKKAGSIRRSKRLLWGDLAALAERLDQERREFVEQIMMPEAQQGMATFLHRPAA